jgi:hypothetical protein
MLPSSDRKIQPSMNTHTSFWGTLVTFTPLQSTTVRSCSPQKSVQQIADVTAGGANLSHGHSTENAAE